jgi:hypothetical protein
MSKKPDGYPGSYVMPFGKHKGLSLDEIDIPYLVTLAEKVKLYGATKDAVDSYLKKNRRHVQEFHRRRSSTWADR